MKKLSPRISGCFSLVEITQQQEDKKVKRILIT